ncbi:hypothetical protein [Blastopirellula marina]|uniref:Uncharacterized protein n=1 Tax=Blastopirellula marina DSM 3645 TaxID=314230 RepID=A3ZLE5_9BACT|nr:hypothetical protein [Blastopirellula marina]EAQ82578.1 hypothetical protein DSM3645_09272 [Blastopirellula marina DSM 3645]
MLGIILGIVSIGLGLKGFTPSGLPLTRKKNITGVTAIVIGVFCCLLGAFLILEGAFGIFVVANSFNR